MEARMPAGEVVVLEPEATSWVEEVERFSGEKVSHCYQCGKCTAGCPVAFAMDVDPARLMRWVQLGQRKRVLESRAIWLCASCQTCTTRCPQGIDVAKVMDTLRWLAHREGKAAEKEVVLFFQAFLENIHRYGRVFEMALVARHNLRSGHWFRDAEKFPLLMAKGKVSLLPPRGGRVKELRRLAVGQEEEP